MDVNPHVDSLRRKHASLGEQIEAAQRSPGTDDLMISELKRKKLRLKEEISKLSSS